MALSFEPRMVARLLMAAGCLAIFAGVGTMVGGFPNFGDAVLIAGALMLMVGVAILVRVPTGENDAG